ncbi:MAG: hypothetical protein ACO27L_00925 [Schleiferiaceae bacterium]
MKGYLLDFLVVVAGISLSFLVEEWRVRQELAEHRVQMVQRLAKTLDDDITDINFNIKVHTKAYESCTFITEYLNGEHPNVSMDSLSYHLSAITMNTVFVPNEEEYETLKNSGQLELVSDPELVYDIHVKYARHDFASTMESWIARTIENEIRPSWAGYTTSIAHTGMRYRHTIGAFPRYTFTKVPPIEAHALTDLTNGHRFYLGVCESMLKRTTELRDKIRSRKA